MGSHTPYTVQNCTKVRQQNHKFYVDFTCMVNKQKVKKLLNNDNGYE